MRDLEQDLRNSPEISILCQDDIFAQNLYAALCNTQWQYQKDDEPWGCSWRYAAGLVASFRTDEGYLDWYCSGIFMNEDAPLGWVNEGVISAQIEKELKKLGWSKYS